jgi:formylglycine-generating enzyme required for sulfatase activity
VDVATNSLPWERALAELTGQFTLQSTPGAEVVALNEAGETRTVGRVNDAGELRADFLLEGRYRFRVTHKDYEPADVADVEIVDGKPAAVKRLLVGLPGRLRMASSKPAEIWEGGKALGKTDETISGLSAGAHALEVRRKGFRTERLRVDVPANGFVNLTAPAFVAEAGGVRVSATVPAHAQAHFAQTAKRLKLGTNPWKPLSALPHVEEGLACETVDVWMEAEGYQPDAPSRRVTVEDGKVAAAAFSLEPLPAKLVVDCAAPGAEVLDAGGQRLGAAGAVLAVPALATASFVVRADGHEDATLPLAALQPGRVHRQSVALMARKGPKLREAMTLDLGGGVGMEMVWIPAGEFDMGSNDFESEKKPVHRVRIGKGFWMGKYEVTNGQYRRFLADSGYDGRGEADGDYQKHFRGNSDQPTGADYPMIWVSWNNAQAFCRWLSQKVNGTVRLPTEAEWEYACRAGTTSRFYSGNTDSDLDGIAWHGGNSGGKTHPVGQKQANAWGLHDMSGNVWEWCQDWYGTYPSGEMTDPTGASSGSRRVLRGGSWLSNPVYCRSAYRYDSDPSYTGDNDGFRVVGVR